MGPRLARGRRHIEPRLPFLQLEPKAAGGRQPLAGDGAAVAEHQQVLQAALTLKPLKAQQGAEGFAGAGAGIDQHIVGSFALEPPAQQRDQLRLPLARLHPRLRAQAARGP